MAEIDDLKAEVKALRRLVSSIKYDLDVAQGAVTNAALEGKGFYVFSADGEYNSFSAEDDAKDHQAALREEGMSSALMYMHQRVEGVIEEDIDGSYTPPPPPSHDPQDVRNAA